MRRPGGPPLVLGLGNILLGDEGVGVRVVEALAERRSLLPEGTRLVDGGTLGLDLLPLIVDTRMLVLVDAVDVGREPGAVVVLEGQALDQALGAHLSPHQVGVSDLFAAARLLGGLPDPIVLIGIQPAEIAVGLALTDVVEAAVPAAVHAVVGELRRLAVAVPGTGPILDRSVATAAMG